MGGFLDSLGKFFSSLFYSGSGEAYNINTLFLQFMILAAIIIAIVTGSIFVAAYDRGCNA